MTQNEFSQLGLSEHLLRALRSSGYQKPTPIQARAIPLVLAGRDLLGLAQMGTGKTAAFTLPLLERSGFTPGQTNSAQALTTLNLAYAVLPCILKVGAFGMVLTLPTEVTRK